MSFAFRSPGKDCTDNGMLSSSLNGDISKPTSLHSCDPNETNEEFMQLVSELETKNRNYISAQQRVSDLEEQMNALSECEIIQ